MDVEGDVNPGSVFARGLAGTLWLALPVRNLRQTA